MVTLHFSFVLLVIKTAYGCDQQARDGFEYSLHDACSAENQLNIFYRGEDVPCGSSMRIDEQSEVSVSFVNANDDLLYSVMLVLQDASYPDRHGHPHLDKVAINIQGKELKYEFSGQWMQIDRLLSCYLNNSEIIKFTFLLFEQTKEVSLSSQRILGLWDYMNQYSMCSPISMSEFFWERNQVHGFFD